MLNLSISGLLIVAGAIHLLPLLGVLSRAQVAGLYDIGITDVNVEILLRHRAVLFGVLGAFLLFSAFRPAYQSASILAGVTSIASFILLAGLIGDYNESIRRVIAVDWVAAGCLTIAAILCVIRKA